MDCPERHGFGWGSFSEAEAIFEGEGWKLLMAFAEVREFLLHTSVSISPWEGDNLGWWERSNSIISKSHKYNYWAPNATYSKLVIKEIILSSNMLNKWCITKQK